MTTLYAIIIACSLPAQDCRIAEDTAGPYATREECHARIAEMQPIIPLLARSDGPGPYRVHMICDTLDNIREAIPGAFEGEQQDTAA